MPNQFLAQPGVTYTNPVTGQDVSYTQEELDSSPAIGMLSNQFVVKPNVIGVNNNVNQVDQGSDEIVDQATQTQNDLTSLLNNMNDNTNPSGLDLTAEFEKLKEQASGISMTTEEELARIDAAGEAAGLEYNPLIADAEERARQGQAANIVATGRRGGFQRARYAGEAALGPTVGDVGYEGSGGKLETSASAYQRNIQAIKDQKNRAIQLAKAQARQAIESGKQQDFQNAKSMLDFARQMNEDAKQAEQDMFDNLFKIKQDQRAQDESYFDIISKIPAGETQIINGREYEGIAVEDIDPFWTSASIVALMKDLPVGETSYVDDPKLGRIWFEGRKATEPNTQVFKSTNENTGDETFTTIDQNTGEMIKQWISKGTGARFKPSTGGNDTDDKEKDKFFTDLGKAADDLRSGATWGGVWNTIYSKYRTGDPEQDAALQQLIDSNLDKDMWAKEGAYQSFKSSNKEKTVISTIMNKDGTKTIVYLDGTRETID